MQNWKRKSCNIAPRQRQRGIALPLVAAGMLAMLVIVGLALDSSRTLANKTRLQNTVDSAALAAAKTYDQTGSVTDGNAAARSLLGINADGIGNHEFNRAHDAGEISITIQWSETLDPFVSTGVGPYVRVIVRNFATDASLTAILGITELDVGASAVAGPSPSFDLTACNIAPMVVCAEDPNDRNLFGFEAEQLQVLKYAAGDSGEIGAGNFHLVAIDGEGGASNVRDNMAGDYDGCVSSGETLETQTGDMAGPVRQGLNTRFGDYFAGPGQLEAHPPDVVIDEPNPALTYDDETGTVSQNNEPVSHETVDYNYEQYVRDSANEERWDFHPPDGVFDRRILALPIASCTQDENGKAYLDVVGFGCYFLVQKVPLIAGGREAQVFGQFIEGCNAGGMPGQDPWSGPAPYRIQLYKDPDSTDS
jgi:Flp pilus assembly protein TadG